MCGKLTLSVVAAALLMSPAPLLAGGLPRLCLPVNGVTADNAKACAKRIADATGIKAEKVELLENNKQWYALVSVNCEQVALSELDNALKDSPFSIPRDNLRLFGQVLLEVEIGTAREQKLLSDLKTVKHLTIGDTKRDKGVLFVMVAMPFPPHMGAETADFGKVSFEKELFGAVASDFGPKSDPPATARDLPAYDGLRAIIEKHKGALKGIRWKCLGCHVQGGVAVPNPAGK